LRLLQARHVGTQTELASLCRLRLKVEMRRELQQECLRPLHLCHNNPIVFYSTVSALIIMFHFASGFFFAICKRIERNNTNFFLVFTVKALYDYQATIPQEFDFQAGDIIAVTDTPDDGWWSGELLDEARRVEGRNVFPSNFVCLF
jgi:hypothetical protein